MSTQTSRISTAPARKAMLALIALATRDELESPIRRHWPDIAVRDLRPAESGLVMLRGRTGGDGAAFNLGEATVSRAVVVIEDGEMGYGHVLGRDTARARLAAIVDALWQRQTDRPLVEDEVLRPVRMRLEAERARKRAETTATRVDFFTLVRGEN